MDGIATGGDKLDPGMGTFVELGCGVGDGDERHHDEVLIGFALCCRWAMHDVVDLLVDCTANSVSRSS